MNLFAHAARLEQENTPFAMAQIIESRGSTPRHQAQMLVMADGQILGTIGGGMIERLVIEEAMAAIAERKPRIFHGRMARNGEHAVGSDCGGAMSVYIDVYGLRPRLVLIGAGHVNRAVAHAAAPLGFDVHVGDCFEGSLNPDLFPAGTHLKQADTISAVIDKLAIEPANFVIIATNHQDKEALERLIKPSPRLSGAARQQAQGTDLHPGPAPARGESGAVAAAARPHRLQHRRRDPRGDRHQHPRRAVASEKRQGRWANAG